MNIQQAKEQIKHTVTAYLTQDSLGQPVIPAEKQRPVFLMGPPGIGKTAIMEQIASEMGIGLISYSMTHHTRQSALGLPFITKVTYDGKEYDVSEYTMSEIIASIYEMMENTGVKNGILFLDEINCVSETLSPLMLQFLQYKVFGRHKVPDGWIVVTAGNPPEFNNSVHEFDIVTWDRLKRMDVEPDFTVWKSYAYAKNVHPAVLTFLETKRDAFYIIESSMNGKQFITARGWEDLSVMIDLYEQNGIPVDLKLISQYVQHPKTARDFAVYYDLFNKYRSDYQIDSILSGKASQEIKARAKAAKFDERYALLGLLLDAIRIDVQSVQETYTLYQDFFSFLLEAKTAMYQSGKSPSEVIQNQIAQSQRQLEAGKESKSISLARQHTLRIFIHFLEDLLTETNKQKQNAADAFTSWMNLYKDKNKQLKKDVKAAQKRFSSLFGFIEDTYGTAQEMLILVTELTIDPCTANFISMYGVKEYFNHNKDLLFHEREHRIEQALLDLDDLNLDELEIPSDALQDLTADAQDAATPEPADADKNPDQPESAKPDGKDGKDASLTDAKSGTKKKAAAKTTRKKAAKKTDAA